MGRSLAIPRQSPSFQLVFYALKSVVDSIKCNPGAQQKTHDFATIEMQIRSPSVPIPAFETPNRLNEWSETMLTS
jgi:hypothetical protein